MRNRNPAQGGPAGGFRRAPPGSADPVRRAVDRLRDAVHPQRIILFGSYARGEQTPDSDIDLMLVEAAPGKTPAVWAGWRKLLPQDGPEVQVVALGAGEFEYWRDTPGSIPYEATHFGKELYAAEGQPERRGPLVVRNREQAARYLKRANDDIAVLEETIDNERISDSIFGFHGQQAAEKLLKAVLAAYRKRAGKMHELENLLAAVGQAGLAVPAEMKLLAELTPFAMNGRYDEEDRTLDRRAVLERIHGLRAWTLEQIAAVPDSGGATS